MAMKLIYIGVATTLLSGAASAADLPRRQAPPVFAAVPVFTWTGGFAGLESAYTFTDRERITTTGNFPANAANVAALRRPPTTYTEQDGVANVGGVFGYNYQFTPGSGFVVGFAVNIDWTDIHKNRFILGNGNAANPALPNPNAFRQSLEWLGTANGRIGYAFDRFLIYGTGGFAFGQVQYDANFYTPAGALQFAGRYTDLETGYDYGGGIEYAIPTDSFLNYFSVGKYLGIKSDAVTIKAEYIHYDLGKRNVLVTAIPGVGTGSYTSRFTTEGNIVRAGFNYKFGGF
ncbi:porin family protein [Methylobacterium sp. WL64]|uniref:outer membrane protein n=1 Tax=Methylobacterium sp. WL64 TaxID=2603894 RepID=UPI0011CAFD91|nr:porin family protein [Methylobacterium sp. WL64]TXN00165.1 porin family protein [Methylobacterium sp. WL64]